MNNLKRVLSLALSGIMLVGMMAVGASAADFSDADKISNTEAVNTLVSLGVINGKDDGSYGPEEIVTRAQMAKMITVALNGGKDFKYGTKATPTYTDIKGHWAESYIEYCTSLNIIAGQGDGTFNPDAPVTASAASKMMLVAIGYDANDEGMVGVDWEVNTNRLADNKGFYAGLTGLNVSEGLTRDDAAQVIFNGCDANMIEYDYKLVSENGNLSTKAVAKDLAYDIFGKKFELLEGVGMLKSISYDKDRKEYTYTVANGIVDGEDKTDLTFKSESDFTSLYGMNVKALYKVENRKNSVYGVFDNGDTTVVATKADITDWKAADDELKIAGTKYTLAQNAEATPVFVAPDGKAFAETNKFLDDVMNDANVTEASALVFVGEDSSKIDYVVLTPATVAKVTFVNSTTVTAGGSYDLKDDVVEEGLKKGDYVKVVKKENSVHGVNTVTKLETVTGTVDATRSDETKIDGTWYKNAKKIDGDALALGEEFDLFVIGKTIFAANQVSESVTLKDVLLFTDAGDVRYGVSEGRAYFTDGTNQIVKVSKIGGKDVSSKSELPDGLYTFKVKNGEYELTTISADNKAGTDEYSTGTKTINDEKIGSFYIADDAVIFVSKNSTKTAKIFKGTDAQKWENVAGATVTLLSKNVKGMPTTQVAFVKLADDNMPVKKGDTKYGFVTSKPETVLKDDETYASYTVWTEDGEIDVLDEDGRNTVAKKGEVISFKDVGDGTINTVTAISNDNRDNAYALKGLNGDNILLVKPDGTESTIVSKDKDTVILYVNTKDDAGVAGGELEVAGEYKEGQYLLNVWVVARKGATTKADLIVYDVAGDIDNYDNDKNGVTAGDKKPAAHVHNYTKTEAKAATCTAKGNKEYWSCKVDGCDDTKKYSDEAHTTELVDWEIDKLDHDYDGQTWQGNDTGDHTLACKNCAEGTLTHTATFADENTGTTCTGTNGGHNCTITHS